MASRSERKQQTRTALLQGALAWVEEGNDFASISIREVAKRAGVVPTSFYRHFTDLDDLALGLVDELSIALRQLMREARHKTRQTDKMIYDSVSIFVDNALANQPMFRFMSQAMCGGSEIVRRAIRNELDYFARELEADIRAMGALSHLSPSTLTMTAQLIINTVAAITVEILDTARDNKSLQTALKTRTVKQIQLILVGSAHWRESSQAPTDELREEKMTTKSS